MSRIDLIETLPPLVFSRGIEVTIGSESVFGTSEDPDLREVVVTSTSQKDHAPSGSPKSIYRVKRRFAFLEASSGGSAETVSTEPPLRKKHNLSFLLGDSKGSTSVPDESPSKLL